MFSELEIHQNTFALGAVPGSTTDRLAGFDGPLRGEGKQGREGNNGREGIKKPEIDAYTFLFLFLKPTLNACIVRNVLFRLWYQNANINTILVLIFFELYNIYNYTTVID